MKKTVKMPVKKKPDQDSEEMKKKTKPQGLMSVIIARASGPVSDKKGKKY